MSNDPLTGWKIIIPGVIGNVLEWYDFALYGYFAPVIAKLFFPLSNKLLSLLLTFGVFAIGYLSRPLGGLVFGHFGDRIGRKKILAIGIFSMAIPTTLMGLLPTYFQVGMTASFLLIACRLLQGMAVGGEFSGSLIYIIELAPENRRGLYGSFAMTSAIVGLLLGSGVSTFIDHLVSPLIISAWGWRIPFLAGIILGIVGLYLRLHMPETPYFLEIQKQHKVVKNPIFFALKNFPKPMIASVGLILLPVTIFYLYFLYMVTFLNTFLKVPLSKAMTINTIGISIIIILTPLVGWLSDNIGRKPFLIIGAFGTILLSLPLSLVLQHATYGEIIFVQICFAILYSFLYAVIPAILVEVSSTAIRYTMTALSFNVGNIFGGLTPFIATYLITFTRATLAPTFYLICVAFVSLYFAIRFKETYHMNLQ